VKFKMQAAYWEKHLMPIRDNLIQGLAAVLIGVFCTASGSGGAAKAQGPAAGPVQPWGLPPLPAGVGPMEKFADVGGTPQGQFLEGGAFQGAISRADRAGRHSPAGAALRAVLG
jgi:hypothetical protein